jgi:hypothetical protein
VTCGVFFSVAACVAQGYCRAVVAPKVSKFRSKYMSKLLKAAM